jgi:hypothetical protein
MTSGAVVRWFAVALVLLGVLGAASARGAAASGWSIQHTPNPSGGARIELYGVSCSSESACIAVGDYDKGTAELPLAERWNGTKWSIQKPRNPSGGTNISLNGVWCVSGNACTAVGDYDNGAAVEVTLAERWNGNKWSIQHTPNPTSAPDSALLGVSCTSKSACIAVGSAYAYATLAERWNGHKWSLQTTPNPTDSTESQLYAVSCASASACTGVGYYFNGTTYLALGERWNGTKWSLQTIPNPAGGSASQLNGVFCSSGSACSAVGFYGNGSTDVALGERWSGTKWSIQKPPSPNGAEESNLDGVSCTSKSACTAAGHYYDGTTYLTLAERWKGG